MEIAYILLGISSLVFLAYLFSHIFEKFHVPDVLFLIIIGLVLGPVTGLVNPGQFGIEAEVFAVLTLLVVLFEAGLNIKLKELFITMPRAFFMMLATLISTVAIIVGFGSLVLDFDLIESLVVGVLLGGVSAGISIPLLKKLPVADKTKSLITFEADINDVFTVSIIFAIIDFTQNGFLNIRSFSAGIGFDLTIALLVGVVTAFGWSQIIYQVRGIQNNIFMTPALVLIVFSITEIFGASGVFAALAFGITLGNLQYVKKKSLFFISRFHEFSLTEWEKKMFSGFVFLLKTYFYVFIGLSIRISQINILFWTFIVTALLFLVRILIVHFFVPKETSSFDKKILERLLPKGLVGAALISLVENPLLQNFTFGVILWSIVFTSILLSIIPPATPISNNGDPKKTQNRKECRE
ncbi:MAG: hypothetical protein GF347_03435 [Candidatus Moranbacteria bacterium]|nr:hypothetical protein [Candidatus Moranbacteria bacterium]